MSALTDVSDHVANTVHVADNTALPQIFEPLLNS